MEHHHLHEQLLHLEQLMPSSPAAGFFAVDSGQDPAAGHFPSAGLFAADDGGWVEDLMQLGEELFGGPADAGGGDDVNGHYQLPWQCDDDDGGGGGSPDDDGGPPPSISLDGDDASPPSGAEQAGGGGELADGDDVSGSTTRKRRDRSKTIVSERKRRVRMKEKLYELRSLVPNITKMDKASIIADAVEYVKNLQVHARKLKEEVSLLEARPRSPAGSGGGGSRRRQAEQPQHGRRAAAGRRPQQPAGGGGGARVTHVGAAQVGGGRFFVTVECERRDGVAAPLSAAAESLACFRFRVESSSIGRRSGPDRVVSTLTLKVSQQAAGDAAIGEASLKLWMMAALLKEGFRPEVTTTQQIS